MDVIDTIAELFATRGHAEYHGEAVSQLEHALQAAHLAERSGAADALVAAALLHDVGHYPFSHAIEELGPPILPHEPVGRQIIAGPEIAPILETRWGVAPERG